MLFLQKSSNDTGDVKGLVFRIEDGSSQAIVWRNSCEIRGISMYRILVTICGIGCVVAVAITCVHDYLPFHL